MEIRHRKDRGEKIKQDIVEETIEENLKENKTETSTVRDLGPPNVDFYGLIYNILSQAFSYIFETFSAYLPYYEPKLPDSIRQRMETFRLETSVPYNSQNDIHEQKLLELWKSAFPEVKLSEGKSKMWSKLGFQGKDPATDFRGGGIFALDNLLYFANNYSSLFQTLLKGEHHQEKFPMALTGLNITMMLFEMLGWGMRVTKSSTSIARKGKNNLIQLLFGDGVIDSKQIFNELYCILFDLFDSQWLALNANNLDFNQVSLNTRQKFEAILSESSSNIDNIKKNTRLM